MNYFIFFFMIHKAIRYTQYQSYRQYKDDMKEMMKSKLYLRIILLINYMTEKNLFFYVEQFPVNCKACSFTVFCQEKMSQTTVTLGRIDISGPDPVSFLPGSSMYYTVCRFHIIL